MTTNGKKMPEDAEMADCDGENVVTMMDVLKEQQDFEEDANAVLGASDDKNCTYSQGYVKRQAIYACLTCCPEAVKDPTKRAGVCLACSLACHENHELIELYTKRNFRCDCGNPKFTQPCTFTPNKTDLNYDNKYNQNFSGIYCNCKRPYPDPESTEEEEMLQCIICEDWLHTNHLEATVPNNDQYAEMICKDCMEDIDFLHDYSDLVVNVQDKEIIVVDPDLDVTNIIKAKVDDITKEKLSNGNEKAKQEDEIVPDSTENNVPIEKAETSEDVEMTESKSEESENKNAEVTNPEQSKEKGDSESSEVAPKEINTDEEGDKKDPELSTDADNATIEAKIPDETTTDAEATASTSDETTNVSKEVEKSTEEAAKADNSENLDKVSEETTKSSDNVISTNLENVESNAEIVNTKADSTNEKKKDDKAETTTNENEDVQDDKITTDKENDSQKSEHKRKLDTEDEDIDITPKKKKLEVEPCIRPRGVKRVYKGATFWPSNFRQKLCTCSECLSMYKDLAVLFLTDLDDTVTAYEALGKDHEGGPSSQYEKGLQALSSLDRVQQINALTEYNNMRDKLLDYLKSFKDRKLIVKEEDIKAFFAGMKPKREPDGVYFCR